MPIQEYIIPELIILVPVLNIIGMILKQSKLVSDNKIPLALGIIGMVLSVIWSFATINLPTTKSVFHALFTAIVQGILVAGTAVYGHQVLKQRRKKDE